MQLSSPELALHFLRCGAAKSDTHAIIADMPPARRGLGYAGLCPISDIKVEGASPPSPRPEGKDRSFGPCYSALYWNQAHG